MAKEIIGDPVVINGRRCRCHVQSGRVISCFSPVSADQNGAVMTHGGVEDQASAVLDHITATLALAGCDRTDGPSMVWLTSRDDFPGLMPSTDYFQNTRRLGPPL